MANEVTYTQSVFNKSRDDKFILVLSLPEALQKISSKFQRDETRIIPSSLQFSVYGSIVPAIEIPEVNVRYAGQTLATSSHSRNVYEPNRVNFTVDNRFNNYWVIYTWLSLLNNDLESIYDAQNLTSPVVVGDRRAPNSNPNMEYRSNISIFALDEYNKRTVEFLYTNAFPISLGGINYNYRAGNEIESFFIYSFSQLIVKPLQSDIENL